MFPLVPAHMPGAASLPAQKLAFKAGAAIATPTDKLGVYGAVS